MLADLPIVASAGRLDPEVQLPASARYALLEFIAEQMPQWRDHPERPPATAETTLTDQLCGHLNSAARFSEGWSRLQFTREAPDEVSKGRSIDLAPRPCGAVIVIAGRRHTQFNILFPIECKRLPTPREPDRDRREYVVTGSGSTGGIQRFKLGYHGAAHGVAAMIGYVQEQTASYWLAEVNAWIGDLASTAPADWSSADCLTLFADDPAVGLAKLDSRHERRNGLDQIVVRHLWVRMNPKS